MLFTYLQQPETTDIALCLFLLFWPVPPCLHRNFKSDHGHASVNKLNAPSDLWSIFGYRNYIIFRNITFVCFSKNRILVLLSFSFSLSFPFSPSLFSTFSLFFVQRCNKSLPSSGWPWRMSIFNGLRSIWSHSHHFPRSKSTNINIFHSLTSFVSKDTFKQVYRPLQPNRQLLRQHITLHWSVWFEPFSNSKPTCCRVCRFPWLPSVDHHSSTMMVGDDSENHLTRSFDSRCSLYSSSPISSSPSSSCHSIMPSSVDTRVTADSICHRTTVRPCPALTNGDSDSRWCRLDSNKCIALDEVLETFNSPINEEQAWAICFQFVQCIRSILRKRYESAHVQDEQDESCTVSPGKPDSCRSPVRLSFSGTPAHANNNNHERLQLHLHRDGLVHENTLFANGKSLPSRDISSFRNFDWNTFARRTMNGG